jgi:hypothetical protein
MSQIRAVVRSCTALGSARYPQDLAAKAGDDLLVHAVPTVLAGLERLASRGLVDGDEGAVDHHVAVPCHLAWDRA